MCTHTCAWSGEQMEKELGAILNKKELRMKMDTNKFMQKKTSNIM